MFPKAKSIEQSFQWIRIICIGVIIACTVITGIALFSSQATVRKASNRIYILVGGQTLEAFAADRIENISVEARDHIKVFHVSFFTLDPDEKVITAHLSKAFYLADRSARAQYDNLKESGYYTNLITANISQSIQVDSVEINTGRAPFYFRCHATEKLIRTSSILTRSLITEGYLRNVARSDNNPHGFLIERWVILENKDLKIENR